MKMIKMNLKMVKLLLFVPAMKRICFLEMILMSKHLFILSIQLLIMVIKCKYKILSNFRNLLKCNVFLFIIYRIKLKFGVLHFKEKQMVFFHTTNCDSDYIYNCVHLFVLPFLRFSTGRKQCISSITTKVIPIHLT